MKRSIGLIANVVLLVVAAAVYTRLPPEVPVHWNFHGEVDGTMARFPGAFLPSLLGIGLWLGLPLLRRIDPRRSGYDRFDGTFHLVINAIALVMAMLQALTLAIGLGFEVDMVRSILFPMGLLFAVMGNYMPRLRSNWWMGIRTPWTLDNEEVWRRTHRLGGRTFAAAGVITMLSTLLPTEAASVVALSSLVVASLVPAAYSYFIWRSLAGGSSNA